MPTDQRTEDFQTVTQPFANRGVNLKKEPSQLEPDEYYQLDDCMSIQEGSITSRTGRKRLSQMVGFNNPHTVAKLRVSGTDSSNPRYVGEGEFIFRSSGDHSLYGGLTQVAAGVVAPADAVEKRWTSKNYSAGTSGDPYIYFATPLKMLKDYGTSPYAALRPWGIIPPKAPILAAVQAAFENPIVTIPATLVPASTTVYEELVLSGVEDLATFTAPSTKASGFTQDGYDSDDYIELELVVTDVGKLTDIRLQFDVADVAGAYVDYYEKSIEPSQLGPGVARAENISTTLLDRDPSSQALIYGPFDNPDPFADSAAPVELPPAATELTEVLRVPKKDFLKVGQAGATDQDTLNWKDVKRSRLMVKSSSTGGGYSITVNYMKLLGGYGPNTEVDATTLPYDYMCTFRNPTTGFESNPSLPMFERDWMRTFRQSVRLTVHGTDDPNIVTSQFGTIVIYRRGGIFKDGLYRQIGMTANPGVTTGVPNSATWDDTVPDADIAGASTLEFDNDPPVTSQLPQPFSTSISVVDPGAGWKTMTLGVTAEGTITVGTKLSLINDTDGTVNEEVIATLVTGSAVLAYFRYSHAAGHRVVAEYVVGKACSLVETAFESMYLAGDGNNPDMVYKSKTGRPEAFPLINEIDGTANAVRVGSPSNGVQAITEFGGELVCLNLNNIYTISTWLGRMQPPRETPAQRGLYSRHAWTKADNAIFYLAYDGVYMWRGGESVKLSEQIDWMFKQRTVNGIAPIDMGQVVASRRHQITFEYHKNELFIGYWDTGGNLYRLRYHTLYSRWSREKVSANRMFSEKDTGRLIMTKFDVVGGIISEDDLEGTSGTSDDFTDAGGTNGAAISFALRTAWFTPGGPLYSKLFGDIAVELNNPAATVTVNVYYDHSASIGETFSIANASGRRLFILPLGQSGAPAVTAGKEARAISLEFLGSGTQRTEFYSLMFNVLPLTTMQRGRITDWSDFGHPHDKRFYELVVEYDTGGQSVNVALDTITGISGSTQNLAVQTFALTGAGRSQATLKFNDGIIAKKIRLRPTVQATAFRVFRYDAIKEDYPPDIVPFTPWSDYGHPYEKHLQHLHLDVDTNNEAVGFIVQGDNGATIAGPFTITSTESSRNQQVALPSTVITRKARLLVTSIPNSNSKWQLWGHHFDKIDFPPDIVYFTEWSNEGTPYDKYFQQILLEVNTNGGSVNLRVEGDGAILQTIPITTTLDNRQVNITLNPQIKAKLVRLTVDPATVTGTDRFQLFTHKYIWIPADRGEVKHSFDWDDLGWLYDKRLKVVTLEYDKGAPACSMLMDTLTGINGTVETIGAQTFPLAGTGRSLQQFPIADGTIVKMIRFHPNTVPTTSFKHWRYEFEFEKYPADIVYFTEWEDLGWHCEKVLRVLVIEIDTGGVDCTVSVQGDGSTLQNFTVNSTDSNRSRILTITNETPVRRVRLALAPGGGGKAQLFRHTFEWVNEPCIVTRWSSLETSFGYQAFKFLKQLWLHYISPNTVTFSIYRDNGTLFYQKVLPAHAQRDVERFFLPAKSGAAFNKSKRYMFELTSASPGLKFYADASRVEFLPLGLDVRQAYQQVPFSHLTQPETGVK